MRVAIIGGKLQGMEAAYLAGKAGWRTLLIDVHPHAPASGLCDETIQADARDGAALLPYLDGIDLIIPAVEDYECLDGLQRLSERHGIPIAYDPRAYQVSSSKSRSNDLFSAMALPMPQAFPGCPFPVVVKPDGESGSRGVEVFHDSASLSKRFPDHALPQGWVAQQYVAGPSYSLEVIGTAGRYVTPQITDLLMDRVFDCKGVTAPSQLQSALKKELERIALRLARQLNLTGIMDIEVIADGDTLRILEIDARLPSQTPIAVYWSTGVNMLTVLKEVFVDHRLSVPAALLPSRSVRLEHIQVSGRTLTVCGEHCMAGGGPVRIVPGFYGADEAITNHLPGNPDWVATLIHSAGSVSELRRKRTNTFENIMKLQRLVHFDDSKPQLLPEVFEKTYDSTQRMRHTAHRR